jgi:hypothetical protein
MVPFLSTIAVRHNNPMPAAIHLPQLPHNAAAANCWRFGTKCITND